MSTTWLPCSVYHENYAQDHAWWQTKFIKVKMILLLAIAFILIPLLAPVADKLGIDLIWFGVLIALNLQTSFLTPPFGFALFYLRSVAPVGAYLDRVTGQRIEGIRTTQIYRGSVAFVLIQILMIAMLIVFPELVTGSLDAKVEVDLDTIRIEAPPSGGDSWGSGGDAGGNQDRGGW